MTSLDVNGIQVNFPFEPYPCQIDYMSKVITCLKENQNGVLESPTGTGKTLSLLCSSLAWQETRKAQVELNKQAGIAAVLSAEPDAEKAAFNALSGSLQASAGASWGSNDFLVPKIIYASRTHSQLSQAVGELKRTTYNYVKTSVIGSREQLCIHPQVQKATNNAAKVHMCRQKVTGRTCHFYNNIDEYKKKGDVRKMMGNVVDIEDMVSKGNKTKSCPYYMARELKADADIVFMPYNYLLDNKSRKAHGVELQGSIIIFDEAHNLEKICEEAASFDLSSLDLATAIEETTLLGEKVAEMSANETMMSQSEDVATVPEFTLEDVLRLKKTLLEIEEKLDEIELPSVDKGKTLEGGYIFELLSKVNIGWHTKDALLGVLDRMTNFLGNDEGSSILNTKGAGLTKIADCLKIVFCQDPPMDSMNLSAHQKALALHFKVHVQKKKKDFKKDLDSWSNAGSSKKKEERILSYWCFSPGHTMRDLQAHGVKVIILTSGTLSPLESFTMEMQIPFPVQLENPHVIEPDQVFLGTVCKGPDGIELNSKYENRNNESYVNSLGYAIRNFARHVPNGLLIFFPAYGVMETFIEKWKNSSIWGVISQYKPIIVEPKGKVAFNEAMDEFYTKVHDPTLSGAIFMAVCRGKVSEGLDFADNNGRAVLITGLPFPPFFDPKVRLKMDYLKANKDNFKGLDGNAWYRQQATRAVNQAIGRVIRHKRDFGAILLLDSRFSSEISKRGLPMWVRGQARVYNTFGPVLRDVIKFFKEAEKAYPLSEGQISRAQRAPKGEDDPGGHVSGVCFEPSFSRRSGGKGHVTVEYERASSVACHIPGLGGDGDESYKALNGYSGDIKRGKKRSLLEALEYSEPSSNAALASSNGLNSSIQVSSLEPAKKKLPGKQKKIKIKKTTQLFGASKFNEEFQTKTSQAKSQKSLDTSQNYVSQVKSAISVESYKHFSESLCKYKSTKNIGDMLAVLADLFTGATANHHLFQKFFRFVRPEDKPKFASVCHELTGLVCETSEKGAPTMSDSSTSASTKASTTKASSSSVSSTIKTSLSASTTKASTTTTASSSSKLSTIITAFSASTTCLTASASKTKTTSSSTPRPDSAVSTTSMTAKAASVPCLSSSEKSSPTETSKPKTTHAASLCLCCGRPPTQGLSHSCGAVCCFVCWKDTVFNVQKPEDRRCPSPSCGVPVKRRNLTVVNTADSGNPS